MNSYIEKMERQIAMLEDERKKLYESLGIVCDAYGKLLVKVKEYEKKEKKKL